MIPPWEVLLIAALVGFYLQDSLLLLHYDELVVTESGGAWAMTTGSAIEVGGGYLYLPNPFLPMRGLFRVSWLSSFPSATEDSVDARRYLARLLPLKLGSATSGVLMLLALPGLLLLFPHPLALLMVMLLVYTTILLMLAVLYSKRVALGLSRRQVTALGFEILLCPPYAINLVRNVCLQRGLGQDPISLAAATLRCIDKVELRASIERRIDMAEAFETESSHRADVLRANRHRIREGLQ